MGGDCFCSGRYPCCLVGWAASSTSVICGISESIGADHGAGYMPLDMAKPACEARALPIVVLMSASPKPPPPPPPPPLAPPDGGGDRVSFVLRVFSWST